jgi:hypothetical protein
MKPKGSTADRDQTVSEIYSQLWKRDGQARDVMRTTSIRDHYTARQVVAHRERRTESKKSSGTACAGTDPRAKITFLHRPVPVHKPPTHAPARTLAELYAADKKDKEDAMSDDVKRKKDHAHRPHDVLYTGVDRTAYCLPQSMYIGFAAACASAQRASAQSPLVLDRITCPQDESGKLVLPIPSLMIWFYSTSRCVRTDCKYPHRLVYRVSCDPCKATDREWIKTLKVSSWCPCATTETEVGPSGAMYPTLDCSFAYTTATEGTGMNRINALDYIKQLMSPPEEITVRLIPDRTLSRTCLLSISASTLANQMTSQCESATANDFYNLAFVAYREYNRAQAAEKAAKTEKTTDSATATSQGTSSPSSAR